MEENIFNDYMEGYINIHNELADLDVSDKSAEIERLKKIVEANDMLVQTSMNVEDIDSNDKEKHQEFEIKTRQYMENIRNAEKEIQDIQKKQEENQKRKEQLENGKNSIRRQAKQYKEERIVEEQKKKEDSILGKRYDYYLKQEHDIEQKLEKFKNVDLETTKEEIERIQLENELRNIRNERKSVSQQLNQETDMKKKVEKDYILFLGQLSLIDKTSEKISMLKEKKPEQEKTEQEKQKQEKPEQEKTEQEKQKQEKPEQAQEQEDIQEKINKVYQEIQEANRDYKNIHLGASSEVEPEQIRNAVQKKLGLPKDVKIEIGRKGTITFNGQTYKVEKDIIKKGVNLSLEETMEIAKTMGLKDTKEMKENLKQCMEQNLFDPTIIYMLDEVENMDLDDKKKLVKQYVWDVFNAKSGNSFKNNCHISYREDDLSKSNLWSRIFRKEIDSEEKIKLINRARTGNRNNIVDIQGEYKPNFMTKAINWLSRTRTPQLPSMEDMQAVAMQYNQLRDKNKTSQVNSYRYMKDLDLTSIQKKELKELHQAEIEQSLSKEEKTMKENIKVNNEDNKIEEKAVKAMKETQNAMAEEVKNITKEKEK